MRSRRRVALPDQSGGASKSGLATPQVPLYALQIAGVVKAPAHALLMVSGRARRAGENSACRPKRVEIFAALDVCGGATP